MNTSCVCECNSLECETEIPYSEWEYLYNHAMFRKASRRVVIKEHRNIGEIILSSTEHCYLIGSYAEEDLDLGEKISSLDTDQEFGNRE